MWISEDVPLDILLGNQRSSSVSLYKGSIILNCMKLSTSHRKLVSFPLFAAYRIMFCNPINYTCLEFVTITISMLQRRWLCSVALNEDIVRVKEKLDLPMPKWVWHEFRLYVTDYINRADVFWIHRVRGAGPYVSLVDLWGTHCNILSYMTTSNRSGN